MRFFAIILFGVCAGLQAVAAPLNPAQINRKAAWICHADFDTFKTTTLAAFIRQKAAEAGWEQKMETFKKMFTFHPIDDIHSVSIYGMNSDQDKAVVLIAAEFDSNKMIGILRDAETITYGPHKIYGWDNQSKYPAKNKREYAAIWKYNLIVMAGSMDSVQQALNVLDGTENNAAACSYISGYVAEPGQFLYVRADQLADYAQDDPQGLILRQMEQILMTAGEINGQFQCKIDLGISSQEKLVEIEQIIRGLLSYGLMNAQQDKPELIPIYTSIQVQPSAGLLSLWMEYKSADLVNQLSKMAKRQITQKNSSKPVTLQDKKEK